MIAPIRAKNTEITVTTPKLLMMLKKESIRETNPKHYCHTRDGNRSSDLLDTFLDCRDKDQTVSTFIITAYHNQKGVFRCHTVS
jgi:hypothetical protein